MFALYIYYYFTFFSSLRVTYVTVAETTIYLCLYLIKHTIFYAFEYNNKYNIYEKYVLRRCHHSFFPLLYYYFVQFFFSVFLC